MSDACPLHQDGHLLPGNPSAMSKAGSSSQKPEGATTADVELVTVASRRAEDRESGRLVGDENCKDEPSQRIQTVQHATILRFEKFDEMSKARIGLILFR